MYGVKSIVFEELACRCLAVLTVLKTYIFLNFLHFLSKTNAS